MAPEQARGKTVDRRADVWAFGCVVFEMLTGKPPFGGDGVTDVLARVLERDPDWTALPANTPTAIRTVLKRCLEKDCRKRIAHISTVLFVLEERAGLESARSPLAASGTAPARVRQHADAVAWRRGRRHQRVDVGLARRRCQYRVS